MIPPRLVAGILALAAIFAPRATWALANCSVSATSVAFGNYSPFNASAATSTGDIAVSCDLLGLLSLGVSYTIKLSAGGAASFAPRKLSSGANRLNYNLYTSAAFASVWGDGSAGTVTVNDGYLIGLFTVVRHYTVFGRVTALQNARSGLYADAIVVTVDY